MTKESGLKKALKWAGIGLAGAVIGGGIGFGACEYKYYVPAKKAISQEKEVNVRNRIEWGWGPFINCKDFDEAFYPITGGVIGLPLSLIGFGLCKKIKREEEAYNLEMDKRNILK